MSITNNYQNFNHDLYTINFIEEENHQFNNRLVSVLKENANSANETATERMREIMSSALADPTNNEAQEIEPINQAIQTLSKINSKEQISNLTEILIKIKSGFLKNISTMTSCELALTVALWNRLKLPKDELLSALANDVINEKILKMSDAQLELFIYEISFLSPHRGHKATLQACLKGILQMPMIAEKDPESLVRLLKGMARIGFSSIETTKAIQSLIRNGILSRFTKDSLIAEFIDACGRLTGKDQSFYVRKAEKDLARDLLSDCQPGIKSVITAMKQQMKTAAESVNAAQRALTTHPLEREDIETLAKAVTKESLKQMPYPAVVKLCSAFAALEIINEPYEQVVERLSQVDPGWSFSLVTELLATWQEHGKIQKDHPAFVPLALTALKYYLNHPIEEWKKLGLTQEACTNPLLGKLTREHLNKTLLSQKQPQDQLTTIKEMIRLKFKCPDNSTFDIIINLLHEVKQSGEINTLEIFHTINQLMPAAKELRSILSKTSHETLMKLEGLTLPAIPSLDINEFIRATSLLIGINQADKSFYEEREKIILKRCRELFYQIQPDTAGFLLMHFPDLLGQKHLNSPIVSWWKESEKAKINPMKELINASPSSPKALFVLLCLYAELKMEEMPSDFKKKFTNREAVAHIKEMSPPFLFWHLEAYFHANITTQELRKAFANAVKKNLHHAPEKEVSSILAQCVFLGINDSEIGRRWKESIPLDRKKTMAMLLYYSNFNYHIDRSLLGDALLEMFQDPNILEFNLDNEQILKFLELCCKNLSSEKVSKKPLTPLADRIASLLPELSTEELATVLSQVQTLNMNNPKLKAAIQNLDLSELQQEEPKLIAHLVNTLSYLYPKKNVLLEWLRNFPQTTLNQMGDNLVLFARGCGKLEIQDIELADKLLIAAKENDLSDSIEICNVVGRLKPKVEEVKEDPIVAMMMAHGVKANWEQEGKKFKIEGKVEAVSPLKKILEKYTPKAGITIKSEMHKGGIQTLVLGARGNKAIKSLFNDNNSLRNDLVQKEKEPTFQSKLMTSSTPAPIDTPQTKEHWESWEKALKNMGCGAKVEILSDKNTIKLNYSECFQPDEGDYHLTAIQPKQSKHLPPEILRWTSAELKTNLLKYLENLGLELREETTGPHCFSFKVCACLPKTPSRFHEGFARKHLLGSGQKSVNKPQPTNTLVEKEKENEIPSESPTPTNLDAKQWIEAIGEIPDTSSWLKVNKERKRYVLKFKVASGYVRTFCGFKVMTDQIFAMLKETINGLNLTTKNRASLELAERDDQWSTFVIPRPLLQEVQQKQSDPFSQELRNRLENQQVQYPLPSGIERPAPVRAPKKEKPDFKETLTDEKLKRLCQNVSFGNGEALNNILKLKDRIKTASEFDEDFLELQFYLTRLVHMMRESADHKSPERAIMTQLRSSLRHAILTIEPEELIQVTEAILSHNANYLKAFLVKYNEIRDEFQDAGERKGYIQQQLTFLEEHPSCSHQVRTIVASKIGSLIVIPGEKPRSEFEAECCKIYADYGHQSLEEHYFSCPSTALL